MQITYINFTKLKKIFLLTGAALLGVTTAFAQVGVNPTTSPFIFTDFTTGTVFQKNGATLDATLNYNTITQEVMFDQNGSKLVLDQSGNIDSIAIQGRVLVPGKTGFYEELTKTPVALYAQYKGKIVKGEALGGRIGTANSTLSGAVGGTKSSSDKPGNYDIKLADGYMMDTQNIYWLKKGSDYTPVPNSKAFIKLFPGKEGQIDAFIKENHITYGKIQDMIKLTAFSNK
jgi:hypothetical protein